MVGELLERILRDRIYSHLEISGHISERQHGFVKGRSCLTNLIEFFEEVTKMIDEGRAVGVVYMDFSKAFDKVPHGRLVQKVKSHGIKGELARWIQNWLGQRSDVEMLALDWGKHSKSFNNTRLKSNRFIW